MRLMLFIGSPRLHLPLCQTDRQSSNKTVAFQVDRYRYRPGCARTARKGASDARLIPT